MSELLPVSIGIGLGVSLLFSELFGLAAGGMVVPGYVALYLTKPLDLMVTLLISVATFLVVRLISMVSIIYGKRRTALMVLVGYLFGALTGVLRQNGAFLFPGGSEITVIGYIIPGLIAIWIDRQGLVETLATLLTAATAVRLIMILVYGTEIIS